MDSTASQARAVSQLPLLDILSPLWTRWRLLGLVFLLTLGMALCLLPFVKQKYKSEAVLILDRASNDIATFDTPLTSLVIDSEAIASEIEILYSGELAARVVASEGLLDTDEFNPEGKSSPDALGAAVRQFLQQLEVQRKGISRAIVVKFESTDAARAARIVNAIVDLYLEHELERKIEQESIASRRLVDEIDTLGKRIAESEVRIAQYRQEVGQSATDDETRSEKNIVELNAQRVLAQAESKAAEAFLQQARSLAQNPAAFAALPSSDISPALARLRNNELDLQTKLDQLALVYGDKHPQVQQTQNQLDRTRRDIRTEIEKSLQVLEGTTQNAALRVAALTDEMQALERAEASTWSRRAQLLALERDRELDVDRLEFYSSRLRELSQSSSIENLKPFARVISSGQISDTAEFPNQRNLLLLLPLLATSGCFGLLVVSGLFRRFTISSLPALPEKTSWFGRIPSASLLYQLPWTASVFSSRRLAQSVSMLCQGIDTALAGKGRVVMLTGLGRGVGVSGLATAVARCYAQSGKSTVLLDLDMRKPLVSNKTRVMYSDDLLSKDMDQTSLIHVLQQEKRTGLFRLALRLRPESGPRHGMLAAEQPHDLAIEQLLSSDALTRLLRLLTLRFSRIVLDVPPVLEAPDSAIVAKLAEVSLIVINPSNVAGSVAELSRGVERLRFDNDAVLGVVLNRMDSDMNDATCMDYVASDHHHALATQAISRRVGSSASGAPTAVLSGNESALSSVAHTGSSASSGAAKEQARDLILPGRTTEGTVLQNTSMMTMVPNRLRGESWLLRQSARQFTLCLMSARLRPDDGQFFTAEVADFPLACYMRQTADGHAEYVILMGLFDSREAAQDMLDRLLLGTRAGTITILALSTVQRDIIHYRSVDSALGKTRPEKDVA